MTILSDILAKLKENNPPVPPWNSISQIVNELTQHPAPTEEIIEFFQAAHDPILTFDTTRRAVLLRTIRISINEQSHCKFIISQEIHWLIMMSLERDGAQYHGERIQALKLMDKFRKIAPEFFPISFARSLVAIGNSKEDHFRKLCIDSLVDLAVVNPSLVATVGGFSTLLDAVLDPLFKEMAEKILHVTLHLLADPSTRKSLSSCIDLKVLLAPFTDLDSDPSELTNRWECAKVAFVTMMKTWVGILYLTSDDLALPLLLRLLNDAKTPFSNQDALLDCLSDILRPIISKDCDSHNMNSFRNGFAAGSEGPELASKVFTDQEPQRKAMNSTAEISQTNSSKQSVKPFFASKSSTESSGSTTTHPNRPFSISSLFTSRASVGMNFRRSSVKNTLSQSNSTGNLARIDENSDKKNIAGNRERNDSTNHDNSTDLVHCDNDVDPVFNLLDNYAAFLCCSLLHVNLLKCLFNLAVEGNSAISEKSRRLLVDFLRLLAFVLPEKSCADLLTSPALIDIASSINSNKLFHKAHKASSILFDLAAAFSVLPCRKQGFEVDAADTALHQKYKAAIVVGKSNIPLLSFSSIPDLSEELKAFHSVVSFKSDKVSISDLASSLQTVLIPIVEKSDFLKQLDQSRVIGKEGKEPFKWDWIIIDDMLHHSFQSSDRIQEALKTKWIKRLSGFFRCSIEEKGYFANLEWEAPNFYFLECASNLYSVLLRDDAGITFLTSDRRGMLFNEISAELEQLAMMAAQKSFPSHILSKNVFKYSSCYSTMSREFFALLGKIVCIPGSKKLLDHTNVFEHLSKLGQYQSLDYLSRTALTALVFTDGGILSKHLYYLWCGSCSANLRSYFHSLLRVMTYSPQCLFSKWYVETIVNQLLLDESDPTLIAALNEIVHDKQNLKIVISKKPNLFHNTELKDVFYRFAAIPEGLSFLINSNWLEEAVTDWSNNGSKQYMCSIEERLSTSLFFPEAFISPKVPCSINAIPIALATYHNLFKFDSSKVIPNDSKTGKFNQTKTVKENFVPDLQGIVRMPWHIEVKLSGASQANENVASSDYVKVDTIVDFAEFCSPLNYEVSFDANRIVKVRGVVLDSKGNPNGKLINSATTISSTMLVGVYSVLKTGQLQLNADGSILRKRASTASTKESSQISGSTRSFAASNGLSLSENFQDHELHMSSVQESLCDWSHCKHSHRNSTYVELDGGRFGVVIPGEPVMLIFTKKTQVTSSLPRNSVSFDNVHAIKSSKQGFESNLVDMRSNRFEVNRVGEMLLVEIVYYLRVECGQAMFVPMPRNFFGEIARTMEGCAELTKRQIIHDLVHSARSIYDLLHRPIVSNITNADPQKQSTIELRSHLWSLGHIGSTEYGIAALLTLDPNFVEWCVHCISNCNFYNLRGTFFYVLGLVSRTSLGEKKLFQNQWTCLSFRSTSAVAVPIKVGVLFSKIINAVNEPVFVAPGMRRTSLTLSRLNVTQTPSMPYLNNVPIPPTSKILTPFLLPGAVSLEHEIINLVLKMPGVILYRECKARLLSIRQENSEIFCNRSLFVEILGILDAATFKLAARREIIDLFHQRAKIKGF